MRTSNLITLLTDFGLQDHFVGIVKGVILSFSPQIKIVDLCHQVPPQDIERAAWLLQNSYGFFPKGTVHLVVVDPGVGSHRKILILSKKDHFFLGPDNGVLGPLLEEDGPSCLYEASLNQGLASVSSTFHGRDLFAPLAAKLAMGVVPEKLGNPTENYKKLPSFKVTYTDREIKGKIVYIDGFGNLITNISVDLFPSLSFSLQIGEQPYPLVRGLSSSYSEGASGKPLAIKSSNGCLEIAVKESRASEVLGIEKGEEVVVSFCEKENP